MLIMAAGAPDDESGGAALNLVVGTYGRNVAIATGEWAEAIDVKLAEFRRAKKKC
jgi:hypothetical protein